MPDKLPNLTGTERQISWAAKIRPERLRHWKDTMEFDLYAECQRVVYAGWWIKHKDAEASQVTQPTLRELARESDSPQVSPAAASMLDIGSSEPDAVTPGSDTDLSGRALIASSDMAIDNLSAKALHAALIYRLRPCPYTKQAAEERISNLEAFADEMRKLIS